MLDIFFLFFLFITRVTPPATRTDTLFPYTTRFRCPATATVGCPAQRQRYLSLSISRPSSAPPAAPSTVPSSLSPSPAIRSEEHTSELQSLMRISYAVFYLKKKKKPSNKRNKCHVNSYVVSQSYHVEHR